VGVYENDFHPLGKYGAEVFAVGAEWIVRAVNGEFDQPRLDERHFMRDDGDVAESSADPQWWLGATPAALDKARSDNVPAAADKP